MVAGANSRGTPITLNFQTVGGVNAGRAFGSTVAGPLWGDSMKAIARWLPDEDFVRPGAAPVPKGSQVVPSTIDMSIGQAVSTLSAAGFTPVVGSVIDSRRAPGVIAGQSPDGGTAALPGSAITVYPSNGANFAGSNGGGNNTSRASATTRAEVAATAVAATAGGNGGGGNGGGGNGRRRRVRPG